MALEKYQSEFTAEDFENAIRAVPNIGPNGNWFIGDKDTGVRANSVDVSGCKVGQCIVVKGIDANGTPTAWEPVDKRTVYRGRIIKLLDHVFNEDIADTSVYDDGIGDMAFTHTRVFTTDEHGAPLKIRRLWYEIYWAAGSKDFATSCAPTVALIGINTEAEIRKMFVSGLYQEKRIMADRGSLANNISDNSYRYGYIDWEKILGEELAVSNKNWKGNATTTTQYPSVSQVAYVLGTDCALGASVTFPNAIKAGTSYKIWVEVAE